MTWFSLPTTQEDNKAAFHDSSSAGRWLAGQPQANASVMLAALTTQIGAYNRYATSARERFKTMEVLRKAVFAVNGECLRRYENRPLPLLPPELALLEASRQLWRACAIAYLHCLRACLDGDSSINRNSAKVAHRVLACLRVEQMNGYLAGVALDGTFWSGLHSVLASAEKLGVLLEPVEDALLGETAESTVSGQYCMMLLLHLADPFALTRHQFAAAVRWFARWREQAGILDTPDTQPKSCCIALDLAQGRAIHDNQRPATTGRWLSLNGVLRKMRKRRELLLAGESPESLKLGSGLSSGACIDLLNQLSENLRLPQQPVVCLPDPVVTADVVVGLEKVHRLLGGKGLQASPEATTFGSRLRADQIAVFDHAVEIEDHIPAIEPEHWQVIRQSSGALDLSRIHGVDEERLVLGNLLAIRLVKQADYSLATVNSLSMSGAGPDDTLNIVAKSLAGELTPLVAEVREKPSGKLSRHPALLVSVARDTHSRSVLLPVGLSARAQTISFYDAQGQSPVALRLGDLLERGGDSERWACVASS